MLGYLFMGISLGLSAGFAPGPLFAMVISQTIKHGRQEGIKAAFSPLITDLPVIILSISLLAGLYTYKPVLGVISFAGGLFVAYLAYENLTIRPVVADIETDPANSLTKGAVVNLLSPHPYLFWVTVGGPIILDAYARSLAYAACFILSFYICLIGAKILLAIIVGKSRAFLTGKAYINTMRLLGALLFIFAALLLKEGFLLLAP